MRTIEPATILAVVIVTRLGMGFGLPDAPSVAERRLPSCRGIGTMSRPQSHGLFQHGA